MKVSNLYNKNGNKVKNQFVVYDDNNNKFFQSYDSIIVIKEYKPERYSWNAPEEHKTNVTLDEYYWNYSRTTSKYRNIFLNETTEETKRKIKEGIYKLANLNK